MGRHTNATHASKSTRRRTARQRERAALRDRAMKEKSKVKGRRRATENK